MESDLPALHERAEAWLREVRELANSDVKIDRAGLLTALGIGLFTLMSVATLNYVGLIGTVNLTAISVGCLGLIGTISLIALKPQTTGAIIVIVSLTCIFIMMMGSYSHGPLALAVFPAVIALFHVILRPIIAAWISASVLAGMIAMVHAWHGISDQPLLARLLFGSLISLIFWQLASRFWLRWTSRTRELGNEMSVALTQLEELRRVSQQQAAVVEATQRQMTLTLAQLEQAHAEAQAANEALRVANKELGRMATTDALTGLPNRRYFEQRAQAEIERVQRYGGDVSLLMLDINQFKKINDAYGHLVGDAALLEVADCIRHVIRSSDLAARWGGDEFVVMLPECDEAALRQVAEKIRSRVGTRQFGALGSLTVSVGGAAHIAGESLAAWLTRADKAFYDAKAAERDAIGPVGGTSRGAA